MNTIGDARVGKWSQTMASNSGNYSGALRSPIFSDIAEHTLDIFDGHRPCRMAIYYIQLMVTYHFAYLKLFISGIR